MSLDPQLKADYAPDGRIYTTLAAQYGKAAADEAYSVSRWGDRADIANAMLKYRNAQYQSQPGSASTLGNFWDQITTDPLAAPLESANNQIARAVGNLLKNPWVLVTVIVLLWGWLGFPGAPALKKKFA